jgi:hypothetical protein
LRGIGGEIGMEWKDITIYSQGDKERVPSVLEAKIDGFNIRVHRHIYYPGTWLLSCHQLGIDNKDLKTDTFRIAETVALNFLIYKLDEYVKLQNALIESNRKEVGLPV